MAESLEETRQRLLDAAGQVFADKGFEAATVREICTQAGANIAAVNYHFGDKESLYIAAVQQAQCHREEQAEIIWPDNLSPEHKLVEFIRRMMVDMVDQDRPTWHLALMMREMAQPTKACEQLVHSFIGPRFAILCTILAELLPVGISPRNLHLHAFSVVGQCLLYRFHRPIGKLLVGEEEFRSLFDVELLTAHIARFCLAALGKPLDIIPPPLSPPLNNSPLRLTEIAP